jgi:hypothetical protein
MVEVFPLQSLHAANLARTMALRPSAQNVQGDVLSGAFAICDCRLLEGWWTE